MKEMIKPCLCGAKPKILKYDWGYTVVDWQIYCDKCGRTTGFILKEKAIKIWNSGLQIVKGGVADENSSV